jgi:hypothetical protein
MTDNDQPEDLDGPVADPGHHRVVFENEHVRVIETLIRPGDATEVHTHLARHLTVVRSGTHFVRRDRTGVLLVDTRDDPDFVLPGQLWSEGIPAHTLENAGEEDIALTSVELKS